MRKIILITLFFHLFSQTITAQNFHPGKEALLASGLPLVEIETEGGVEPTCEIVYPPEGSMGLGITNKTKVPSRMTITKGEELLYDSGEYEEDASGLLLSYRGNTSATLADKKPYKLKLQKKADLLFRGDKSYNDKEWGLLKCENGKFLNTLVGFKVNEMAGLQWTPRFMYVNVAINGDYKGVYMLMETVKDSKARLSVDKDSGYIIEYDAYWWNEDLSLPEGQFYKWISMRYTFKYPESDDITPEQVDFIQNCVKEMEKSITTGNYEQLIDVPSFAAWLIAHDILGDSDGCGSNIFLTLYNNELESKFQMGNIWDLDAIELAEDKWAAIHDFYGFYFKWLFESKNKVFLETYKNKWAELSPSLVDELHSFLDNFSISEEGLGLAACIEYDAQRWWYAPSTLSVEIEKNKLWFTNRRLWLDEHVAEIQYLWKTYTATFDNAGAWENVYAYAWYNDGVTVQKLLGDWPGVELKKNEETGLYDVTIETTKIPEKIVFSDGTISNGVVGKNQTKDFVFENDKLYVWNEYAVTFSTNRNWDSVYAYAWSDDEPKDEYSELWPGTLLERIESVYEYRFHAEKEPQWIVFNDGTIEDNMEATNKTETYNFVNNKEYIDNTSTAIHNIQQRNQRDSIIYNLNGQRVKNAVKGLYIINGKIVSAKY